MTPIHVIGIGLTGGSGLQSHLHMLIDQATVLVGSERHLQYFPLHPGKRITLTNFAQGLKAIQQHLDQSPNPLVVVITSGDPLFSGLAVYCYKLLRLIYCAFIPISVLSKLLLTASRCLGKMLR